MSKDEKKNQQDQFDPNDDSNLKGSFVSVMLLGVFLILSWVGVFILFMVR